MEIIDTLRSVAGNNELLEIGRKAVEDCLVEWRDSRMSMVGRGNGLVIREHDGKRSDIIRMGPEDCLRIGLTAIAEHLAANQSQGIA